jgi:hypothetical protein
VAEPQLGLFGGLLLGVAEHEPAPKKRRARQPTEDAESERVVRADLAAVSCAHHPPAYICRACSSSGDTDATGFLHRQVCEKRIPLRRCRGCQQLRSPGRWNHKDYFHCTDCIPLGSAAVPADPF